VIRWLSLENIRCFEREKIDLDPRVTVVLGENGSGKSTLAHAVASLAWGEEGLRAFPLRWGAQRGQVTALTDEGTRAEWTSEGRRTRFGRRPWLLVYGRHRGIVLPPGTGGHSSWDLPEERLLSLEFERAERPSRDLERDRTTTIIQPDPALLLSRTDLLLRMEDEGQFVPRLKATYTRLERSLKGLGEGIEGLTIEERGGRDQLMLRYRGSTLPFDAVADGYKSVLSVVFDLVARFVWADSAADPLATRATVLVDEVDLHLHPRWQRRVVGQLTDLFPNVQWVLTTHSPAVVQGAIDGGHRVVRLSHEAPRVRVLADDTDLARAELGAVLLDASTFGVHSRYSPEVEGWEREVGTLRWRLSRGRASPDERHRLIGLLDRLQQLHAADEGRKRREVLLSELARVRLAYIRQLEAEVSGDQA